MQRYNPKEIEPKWQAKWEADKIYEASISTEKPKRYVLEYFPYPSGVAMHVGHVRNYAIGDVIARTNRMQGFNVLHPMGWDAFGLPAENYAIKNNVSPRVAIDENTARFKKQLIQLGLSYDWSREIDSTDPGYYKWTQWFFLLLFKKGLAYQREALVNWDPIDKTVLANEQIIDGKAERSGAVVEKKLLEQWFFKITDYADRLLNDLDDLDWSEAIKSMQRNWIGRSQGAEIDFPLESDNSTGNKPNFLILHGFTGYADTNFLPWLKNNLEEQGFEVQTPQMPNTDNPKEEEQVGYVMDNCKIDENTVIIGHSLGGAVAMKILEKLDHKIRELILVAPAVEPKFAVDHKRVFWDNFSFTYDYQDIAEKAGKITILSDNAESDSRGKYLEFLADKLGCKLVKVDAEKRHFVAETEPSVLDVLIPKITIFTTRHDTQFGVTFIVLAPEHPLLDTITSADQKAIVDEYRKQAQHKTELERQSETDKVKTGVFSGAYAINPANNEKIPIWVADYVLMGYGTGAVMGVPAHDDRDHVFAEKYDLPILQVLKTDKDSDFHSEGVVINSGKYNGMRSEVMREKILQDFIEAGVAKEVVNYKMRDWLISRQRYWGAPIPIIHCPKDGTVAVPEDQLPVVLPEVTSYAPSGDGHSPLANVEEFVNTTCPTCGGPAKRETDTMDGFACSSWYFLRFADPHNDQKPFSKEMADFWLPVDDYIGGAEHAVMHLLYARFWTKVMYDDGLIKFQEPFTTLRNHGMILAPNGQKMSKSKGNTIEPDEIIDQGYGADSIRILELFIGPWNQTANWSVEGMGGSYRFLQRVWTICGEYLEAEPQKTEESFKELQKKTHKVIKVVTKDITQLGFNTSISSLMEFVNDLYKLKEEDKFTHHADWDFALTSLLKLLSPFAPHITEELWSKMGNEDSIHLSSWPTYDEKLLIEETVTIVIQVNGKLRGEMQLATDTKKEDIEKAAKEIPRIAALLDQKDILKTITVPNKLVNFVI
jgi:leucyl-tRNA synthetase